eukprot:Platyproteum_vivax@DN298_c0_g1_i1.p1
MENWDPGFGYPSDRKIPRCFSQAELDTLADSTAVEVLMKMDFTKHGDIPISDMTFWKSVDSSESKVSSGNESAYTYGQWEIDHAPLVIKPCIHLGTIFMPLWLAIDLHRQQRCQIQAPFWLRSGYLEELLKAQSKRGAPIIPIHPYFFEIATLLFRSASDIFENFRDVHAIVDRLSHVRLSSLLQSLKTVIKEGAQVITLVSLTSSEINFVRQTTEYLMNSLGRIDKIHNCMEIRRYMIEREQEDFNDMDLEPIGEKMSKDEDEE